MRGPRANLRRLLGSSPVLGRLAGERDWRRVLRSGIDPSLLACATCAAWGATAFDVGAADGRHSLVLANRVERQGLVVAFEPNPALSQRLRTRLVGTGVVVDTRALSYKPGRATLCVPQSPQASFAYSLATLQRPMSSSQGLAETTEYRSIDVPTTSIDEEVDNRGIKLDLLKIDVEGHEPAVLVGAQLTLHRNRPIVIFELDARNYTYSKSEMEAAIVPLLSADYHVFLLDRSSTTAWIDYDPQAESGAAPCTGEVSPPANNFIAVAAGAALRVRTLADRAYSAVNRHIGA